jgi:hypothetical protein
MNALWWSIIAVLFAWFSVNLVCGVVLFIKAEHTIRRHSKIARRVMRS